MKRKRSNHSKTRQLCDELIRAHASAKQCHWSMDKLHWTRAEIIARALAERTNAEFEYVCGFGRAMWETTQRNDLVWRLGTAAGPIAEGARWDYGAGAPTHGAHFWRGTDVAYDRWEPLFGTRAGDATEVK